MDLMKLVASHSLTGSQPNSSWAAIPQFPLPLQTVTLDRAKAFGSLVGEIPHTCMLNSTKGTAQKEYTYYYPVGKWYITMAYNGYTKIGYIICHEYGMSNFERGH